VALDDLISNTALDSNPRVTGWDDAWRPLRLDFDNRPPLAVDAEALRDAAEELGDAAGAACAALDAFAQQSFHVPSPAGPLRCGSRTLVMGIINTTPDSFSDGGRWLGRDAAVEHGLQLTEQGADLLDVGGESTRPGAEPVPADEELRRTVPVVAELVKRCAAPVSIDTMKAEVAAAALDAGAAVVNDVSALGDPAMGGVVARSGAALVLMHMRGEPRTMQKDPTYRDVLGEITAYLRRAMRRAFETGIGPEQLIVDPGIGFGKTLAHNTEILRRLPVLTSLGRPILMGCSRKSMIQHALGLPVGRRLHASLALNVLSIVGRASIIRVHDVAEAAEVAAMTDAVRCGGRPPRESGAR
jgi:dihydropteroate synthase